LFYLEYNPPALVQPCTVSWIGRDAKLNELNERKLA
jgi:hypothetical protein